MQRNLYLCIWKITVHPTAHSSLYLRALLLKPSIEILNAIVILLSSIIIYAPYLKRKDLTLEDDIGHLSCTIYVYLEKPAYPMCIWRKRQKTLRLLGCPLSRSAPLCPSISADSWIWFVRNNTHSWTRLLGKMNMKWLNVFCLFNPLKVLVTAWPVMG